MVIVELQGGLGNQVFQYAMGRAVSLKLREPLALDTHILDIDRKRKFGLDVFRIADTHFSSRGGLPWRSVRGIAPWMRLRLAGRFSGRLPMRVLREDDSGGTFDPQMVVDTGDVIFSGYFQSPRYFQSIRGILVEDLTLLRPASREFFDLLTEIERAKEKAVSVHVRRGDYASDPSALATHGLIGRDYYERAADFLQSRVGDATAFVFTDDLQAVAEVAAAGWRMVVVSGRGLSDAEELLLMSVCTHHIIANSSYSWWGAWLSKRPGITIAPRRWFAAERAESIKDRFPSDWIIL